MTAAQFRKRIPNKKAHGITLNIMLITDDDSQVEQIKEKLEKSMHMPWSMMHCIHLKEIKPRISKADVIVFDAGDRDLGYAKRLFEAVKGLNYEIPIIVLTEDKRSVHELAVFVMEKGASDIMIRGAFGRLVDAIEYAIIRQTIITRERIRSKRMRANQECSDKAKIAEMERAATTEQMRQAELLDMFLGGYSVQKMKTVPPDEAERREYDQAKDDMQSEGGI